MRRSERFTAADMAAFLRQLHTLLVAGVPLLQSFTLLMKASPKKILQRVIQSIKKRIESGASLADALRREPRYFNELLCNLVQVGEQSGTLEVVLERLALHQEKVILLKAKIHKALWYPLLVVVIALGVTVVLLLYVVPKFQTLFASVGAELPVLTRFILDLSAFMQAHFVAMVLGVVSGAYGLYALKQRSQAFQYAWDQWTLRLPGIGVLLQHVILARFARTLFTTFSAGVPLLQGIKGVANTSGNRLYQEAWQQVYQRVSQGQSLHQALAKTALFPPLVLQMISIGEASGNLELMLQKMAQCYEQKVDQAVDQLSTLLEPILMAVLGVIVGTLVLAMYLPIFQMGAVL